MSYTKYLNRLKIDILPHPKSGYVNMLKYDGEVVSTMNASRPLTLIDFVNVKIYDIDNFYKKIHKV